MSEALGRRSFIVASAALGVVAAVPALADTRTAPTPATGPANPHGRFAGKVVLITGATSGIGEATARAFAHEGARVVFNGRREELGRKVEAEIRAAKGDATYIKSDVRDEAQVKAFVEAAVAKHGQLDIAFNNAGTDKPPASIADLATDEFDDQVATNLRGVFLSMKHEIPHLVKSRGAMINMGSVGGRHAFANIAGYAATKAAVMHLTRCCAQEFGKHIRVNAIAPGAIDTDMLARVKQQWRVTAEQLASAYPMGRLGTAQEVASVVLWLASAEASYVSGQIVGIDGGDLA